MTRTLRMRAFWADLAAALSQWRLAWLLTMADLVEMRRVNGVALVTPMVSILVQVGVLGFIFANLWDMKLEQFLPYFGISLAIWQAFSAFLGQAAGYNEKAYSFQSYTDISPYIIHFAGLFDTMLLLGLKILSVALIIGIAFPQVVAVANAFYVLIGALILAFFLFPLGLVGAYLLDRVRILRGLLPQILFVGYLISPILWHRDQLKKHLWLADWNPIDYLIQLVRVPFLTGQFPTVAAGLVLVWTVALFLIAWLTHGPNRRLIAFRWIA